MTADHPAVRPLLLPGCPNPYQPPNEIVLCGCPGGDEERPRHWVYEGVPFFCRCAPREYSGLIVWGANPDGFACLSCARGLPGRSLVRRLVCDVWCCWCGGLARENSGFRIDGHPSPKISPAGGPPLGAILKRED